MAPTPTNDTCIGVVSTSVVEKDKKDGKSKSSKKQIVLKNEKGLDLVLIKDGKNKDKHKEGLPPTFVSIPIYGHLNYVHLNCHLILDEDQRAKNQKTKERERLERQEAKG